MMNSLDFRNFKSNDESILLLDGYRHLAYFNLSIGCGGHIKRSYASQLNYVGVFNRYYKRLKKIRKKYLGFEIDYNVVDELIFILEDHHKKKIAKRYGVERRKLANKKVNKVRKEIMRKYGYKCNYCQSTEKLTIDHIIPITKGGNDYKSNLQVLCFSCNVKKSNKL